MKMRNKILIGIGIVALILVLGFFYVFLKIYLSPPCMGPLKFSVFNHDESKHDVAVEIFDSNNKTIFNKNYSIRSRESIHSPEITEKRGEYMLKVTLDNNITKMHKTYVSEGHIGVHITIYSSHYPIPISISDVVGD